MRFSTFSAANPDAAAQDVASAACGDDQPAAAAGNRANATQEIE
jgi:hypothetical protein